MSKDAAFFIKVAEAYLEDVDLCLRKAASHGYFGLDYTEEKLAAFKRLMLNLDTDEIAELDKTAMAELDAMEKIAFWGAIARGAVGLGSKMLGGISRGGAAIAQRGAQFAKGPGASAVPSKNWMGFMTGRHGAEKAKAMAADFTAAGGARGWMAQRKATMAAGAASGGAAPPGGWRRGGWGGGEAPVTTPAAAAAGGGWGGAGAPSTTPAAAAPGSGNGRMKEIWKQTKSGLLWGGGFGLANRLMSPAEEPEYRMVGRN